MLLLLFFGLQIVGVDAASVFQLSRHARDDSHSVIRDVKVALHAPERNVRKAHRDGVLGRTVVFLHVLVHVSRTEHSHLLFVAAQTDPVLALVVAFATRKAEQVLSK